MKLRITVEGKTYDVDVEVLDGSAAAAPPGPTPASASGPTPDPVTSPIAGTVSQVLCEPGDTVSAGDVLIVLEAMKMETNINAPAAGTVKAVHAGVGDTVTQDQVLIEFA